VPNQLKITAENSEELLNAGAYDTGALIRVQSSATQAGTFLDLSGSGSTPTLPLVAGTRSYTAYDPAGTSTTWYRSRFENAAASRVSDWSTAFQPGAGGYCNLYDVKQDLDKVAADTTADELLLDYIREITDYIRGFTGREFATESGTFTFDGIAAMNGGKYLSIPRGVQSISLLEAAANTGGSFTTIPSSAYVLRPTVQERTPGWPATELWLTDNYVGSSYSTFPRGYDNIRVTGVLGFGVPARIEGVARRTVVRAYAARQAGQNDMLGVGQEGGTPTVSRSLSRSDREILNQFVLMQAA
jgi:hypothetical protein